MVFTVLLVDDEQSVLDSLQRALHGQGFAFVATTLPLEAMELLRAGGIQAIVSDQEMPEMSGTKLLSWVHRHSPDVVRFMLTGNATIGVAIEAINEGAIHRFFTKPCNPVDLSHSLRQAIQQVQLLARARELYRRVKEQESLLDGLETRDPGITNVMRDGMGSIVLEEPAVDLDAFLAELEAHAKE